MCDHDSHSSHHGCGCGGHHRHGSATATPQRSGAAGGTRLTLLPSEESDSCGCGCGGHGHGSNLHDPHADVEHACHCGGCPRRYHSLAGLVLGAYLLVHLMIGFLGFWPERYQSVLSFIHRNTAALIIAEIVFILVPLVVHVGYGLRFLWREGIVLKQEKHHYGSATRFFWQRISAVILLAFIVFHVATLHPTGLHAVYKFTHWSALDRYAAGGLFQPDDAYASTVRGVKTFWNQAEPTHPGNVLVMGFYLAAVLAAVYHLANGISTSAMVWDWTPDDSPEAARLWKFCIAGGLLLALLGVAAWVAFTVGSTTLPPA